jgi:glycosyltransferase involved in cell wall biosynthesis
MNQQTAHTTKSQNAGHSPHAPPVRVLIVAPSLGILGGQAVQASRLLERLGKEPSLEVSFLPVNPRLPGPLARLQAIKYVRTVATSLLYVALLLLRVRAYDVIHVFSASYWSFLLAPAPAMLIARLYGKKVLLNYRSGEAQDHLQNWRTALPIVRLAHTLVVPSGYLKDVFGRFGVGAEIVPNTIDLSRFVFRHRRPLRPVLLSNRNLEPLYNVECALRAHALVEQRIPDARLIVAGDGSERERLRTMAREELGLKNVEFVGSVKPEDMPALCDRAEIFVNASNIDNMPVSHIEAFACGLPVVTSDAGGIPYIVTHERTGLMVPRGDHRAMAESILRLLEDERLAENLIEAARADCELYTWAAVRGGWLRIYRELAENRNARRDHQTATLKHS